MTKQIIGLDLDGVIIDNTNPKIEFAKKMGFDLKPENTPAERLDRILPTEILAPMREFLYYDPKTALRAEIVRGAKTGLERIKKSGYPYFLISKRAVPRIAVEILKKHGLWPKYFNHDNSFFISESESKDPKAAELGINVFLDDQPAVLAKLPSVPQRILFDRYKVFGDLDFEHIKVNSWEEFITHII
jgi:hypothetical protein